MHSEWTWCQAIHVRILYLSISTLGNINTNLYIYKYMGVDLKVHLGIFHYEGRQCYNMMRPCVFSGARESIFFGERLSERFILIR